MNRRNFFATLTAVGVVAALPKKNIPGPETLIGGAVVAPDGKVVGIVNESFGLAPDPQESIIAAIEDAGIDVNRELWYG